MKINEFTIKTLLKSAGVKKEIKYAGLDVDENNGMCMILTIKNGTSLLYFDVPISKELEIDTMIVTELAEQTINEFNKVSSGTTAEQTSYIITKCSTIFSNEYAELGYFIDKKISDNLIDKLYKIMNKNKGDFIKAYEEFLNINKEEIFYT